MISTSDILNGILYTLIAFGVCTFGVEIWPRMHSMRHWITQVWTPWKWLRFLRGLTNGHRETEIDVQLRAEYAQHQEEKDSMLEKKQVTAVEYNQQAWDQDGAVFVKARLDCGHIRTFNVFRQEYPEGPATYVKNRVTLQCRKCENDMWIQSNETRV